MPLPDIIAIDGPAASGKSTLAVELAKFFNYLYFDTGVMYRAITWLAQQQGLDLTDETQMTDLAQNTIIDVRPASRHDGRKYDVWINGQDITWEIRQPMVDTSVSIVAAYRGVRQALSAQQRRIGMRGKVVMVGRDIGTVVLPDADLKIFLEASPQERARRRYQERLERGEEANLGEIMAAMHMRDQIDSTRSIAPLRPAEDAIVIDSDKLDPDEVVETVLRLIKEKF